MRYNEHPQLRHKLLSAQKARFDAGGPRPQSDVVEPRERDQDRRRAGSHISRTGKCNIEQCPRYVS